MKDEEIYEILSDQMSMAWLKFFSFFFQTSLYMNTPVS